MNNNNLSWHEMPAQSSFATNQEIHIWRTQLNLPPAYVEQLLQLLSQEESDRAARFKFAHHRRRYIVAKASLRLILSRYLEQPADKFVFNYNAHGKPELANATLQFNSSDSNEMAIYAINPVEPVGIDLEYIREQIEVEAIAERFFSDYEVQILQDLPTPEKTSAFFNIWTRKEAFIKALGLGLSFPLKDFDVNATLPAQLIAVRNHEYSASDWSLFNLSPDENYAGALAVPANGKLLKLWDYLPNVLD